MKELNYVITGSNHTVRRQGDTIYVSDTKEVTPISNLVEALKDEGYYQSWKSNIAMAFIDEIDSVPEPFKEDLHNNANNAADRFLKLLMQ